MNITLEAEEFWEAFCDHNADLNKEELYYEREVENEVQ